MKIFYKVIIKIATNICWNAIDKTNRYAWYLDEDDTIKVDQSKLEAEKTLATGLGFIQFTKKRLEIENVANDIPPIERVQIFQAIKDKLSNWKNEAYKNYWDFLEQMQTPFIENTWNVFNTPKHFYKQELTMPPPLVTIRLYVRLLAK